MGVPRHNNDLRQKVEEASEHRARLEADRSALQDQLRTMQHQPAPRTRFDATSPVDKAVALLDGLLAVSAWPHLLCLACLKQPADRAGCVLAGLSQLSGGVLDHTSRLYCRDNHSLCPLHFLVASIQA